MLTCGVDFKLGLDFDVGFGLRFGFLVLGCDFDRDLVLDCVLGVVLKSWFRVLISIWVWVFHIDSDLSFGS